MFELRRISYSYNSLLEGDNPYFLDALVQDNEKIVLDVHQGFKTYKEFREKIEDIIPLLAEKEDKE